MRKRNLAAVPPVYAAARNKRRGVRLCGICLGLAMAASGCGADGRQYSMTEEAGIQSVQDEQEAQDTGNARDGQEAQDTGNARDEQDKQEATGTQNEEEAREQVLSEMTDEQKNWMGGLSREQQMEEFESLCDGLRENYPYVKLAKRQAGADLDTLEEDYRAKVEQCANDDAFYYVLKDFIGEFSFTGHLDLWGRRYESELAFWRAFVKESGQEAQYEPYIDALDNPVSRNTYASMTKYYQEVGRLTEEKRAAESDGRGEKGKEAAEAVTTPGETTADATTAGETAETTEAAGEPMYVNVETEILEPGKTAYVSINTFDYEQMETDRETLLSFYQEVRDYENLIIDITNNPGGSMQYFDELVAAPLTKDTLTVPGYQLFKDGENNRTFLRVKEGIASGLYRPVSELPPMPELNREDAADCDWFLREDYTVEPVGDGFDGKIWLLVSENNYSSSEYAAMFSKASGFATLVGRTTAGDGIGTAPVYLILPNSGLVVQYSPMYGVTADGTGSEACGTVPDVVSVEGESALETCLKAIGQEK
ncbi:MAG: hypothetical protein K2N39_08160 [Lachnospiraceae bacterium]|nr:hypothetical protein [Lachnospiraceae bacterium]